MKTAALRQAKLETTMRDTAAVCVVDRTAEISLACPAPEQQLWSIGGAFTATCEAIQQWGRRVAARLVGMTWPAGQEPSMYSQSVSRGPPLVSHRIWSLSARSLLYALLITLAFDMQPYRVAINQARADEIEAVYPGRYAANCKPAPIVGCVCETDSPGQPRQLFQSAGESDDHDRRIGDIEYLRMMEWLRATCTAITRPGGLR